MDPPKRFPKLILYSNELLHILELRVLLLLLFVFFREVQASQGPKDNLYVSTGHPLD